MTTAARPSLRGTVAVCRRDETFNARIDRAWFRGARPVLVEIEGERYPVVRGGPRGDLPRPVVARAGRRALNQRALPGVEPPRDTSMNPRVFAAWKPAYDAVVANHEARAEERERQDAAARERAQLLGARR